MTTSKITTDQAPAPAAAYSQGVVRNGFLQVSGQGPIDPATNEYVSAGDVRAQTSRVLENVEAILEAGGATMADVVMLRVYLASRDDFAAMNEAYGSFMSARLGSDDPPPCRTTVIVGLPHEDMLVEIDALAVVG